MSRERPYKRTNPSGDVRWIARYTGRDGSRKYAGTYALKREAEAAIDDAYDQPETVGTLGEYAATWIDQRPRGGRTNRTNRGRLDAVLGVEIEGRALADWPWSELRPRQAERLIDHMLTEQGRAPEGARGILRTLSAMAEDAITDEVAEINWVRGRRVRSADPRAQKAPAPPRVFALNDLRRFAEGGKAKVRAATPRPKPDSHGKIRHYSEREYEPMLLAVALTGLRIGEVFALSRADLEDDVLHVRGTADDRGNIILGDSETKRHVRDVPLSPKLASALKRAPGEGELLFPNGAGGVWQPSTFRRDVWIPARLATGLDIRPHDCRHSWISHMRAAGIDPADLAQMSAHTVATATAKYTHALGRSMDAARKALDQ